MTTDNNNIKHYSAEDIARYWQGKMSPQEMHALESAAMDDPFLADALEGYSTVAPETIHSDVQELHRRLKERSSDEKIVPLKKDNKWWRIAAALILLFGAGTLTYTLFQQNDAGENKVSQMKKNETPAASEQESNAAADKNTADSTPQDTNYAAIRPAQTAPANDAYHLADTNRVSPQGDWYFKDQKPTNAAAKQQDVATEQKNELLRKSEQPLFSPKRDTLAYKPLDLKKELAKDTLFVASSGAQRNADNIQARASGIQNSQPVMSEANRRAMNNNAMNENERYSINNFSGRVVDRNNNAIPNASIGINNNQVVRSSNDGYFQLKSLDTTIDLSVMSSGYVPRQLTMRGNQPTQEITLEQSVGKKVDYSYTTKSKKSPTKETALNVYVMDAQPVAGWDKYNDYLDKNKRVDSAHTAIKGEVIVSFWVGRGGKLSDFTIERSLDPTLDAEAIRLIKEGPEWKLEKGKKARARAIVTF